jgi:hypothetical protein
MFFLREILSKLMNDVKLRGVSCAAHFELGREFVSLFLTGCRINTVDETLTGWSPGLPQMPPPDAPTQSGADQLVNLPARDRLHRVFSSCVWVRRRWIPKAGSRPLQQFYLSTQFLRKMRYQPLLGFRQQKILPARFDTLPNPGAFGHTHIVSIIILNRAVR